MDESFYRERGCPVPEGEVWPEDRSELVDCVRRAGDGKLPVLLVGGGHHLRPAALDDEPYRVVRTGDVDAVRALDLESGTVRVEAGCEWQELRSHLAAEGWSLARYAPRPAEATIGGLLARRRPTSWQKRDGGLRERCVALAATSPAGDAYDYLPAPRKATGPDHRFLYIGGQGALGVVLEATLVVWPRQPGRLIRWEAETVEAAVEVRRQMHRLDVPVAWAHWRRSDATLRASLRGAHRLLDAYVEELRSSHRASMEVAGESELREVRRAVERDHPESVAHSGARAAVRLEAKCRDLGEVVRAVAGDGAEVEIFDWTARRATAVVRPAREGVEPSTALDIEPLRGRDGDDWPKWSERLKRRLDPDGVLAVGP